jgi:pilus assembly protein Flp/PilA
VGLPVLRDTTSRRQPVRTIHSLLGVARPVKDRGRRRPRRRRLIRPREKNRAGPRLQGANRNGSTGMADVDCERHPSRGRNHNYPWFQGGGIYMLNELSARIITWAMAARDDESGQGLVEYALILVLVSIAAIGTLTILGGDVSDVFTTVSDAITGL